MAEPRDLTPSEIVSELDRYIVGQAAAKRAVAGDYFKTGEELIKRRRKDVGMNTEVQRHGDKAESDE